MSEVASKPGAARAASAGLQAVRFKADAIKKITDQSGVYALCDLENIPLYVGIARVSVRQSVALHLGPTKADDPVQRLIDPWEVATVWAWPMADESKLEALEAHIFRSSDPGSKLANHIVPRVASLSPGLTPMRQDMVVLPEAVIQERRLKANRIPRQVAQYKRVAERILNGEDSPGLRRTLAAHFERLMKLHRSYLAEPSGPYG